MLKLPKSMLSAVFLIIAIVYLTGAGIWPQDTLESDHLFFVQAIKAIAYPIFVIQAARGLLSALQRNLLVTLVFTFQIAIVLASIVANGEYFYAGQAFIRLLALTFGAYKAYEDLGIEGIVLLTAKTLTALLVASIVVCVLVPSYGLHVDESGYGVNGLWRGVFIHKNHLGHQSMLLILLASVLAQKQRLYWLSVLIGLICLIFSRSSTAIIGTTLGLCGIFGLAWSQRLRLPSNVVALPLIVVGLLGTVWLEPLLQFVAVNLFDKDTTFTGRTDVWIYSWTFGEQAPLLGNGPGFLDSNLAARDWLESLTFKNIRSSHSAPITTFTDTGYLGLAAYLLPAVLCISSWFRNSRAGQTWDSSCLVVPVCLLIFNFFESHDYMYNGYGTLLLNVLLIYRMSSRHPAQSQSMFRPGVSRASI